jgi:hypothetical protein
VQAVVAPEALPVDDDRGDAEDALRHGRIGVCPQRRLDLGVRQGLAQRGGVQPAPPSRKARRMAASAKDFSSRRRAA